MKQIIYSILVFILYILPFMALAEGPIIDPATTPSKVINCISPIEFTDNTPIPVGTTKDIVLYRSVDGTTWDQIGLNTSCTFTEDVSLLPEGQYYYEATAIVLGEESARSNRIAMEVRITRVPFPPTGLTLE